MGRVVAIFGAVIAFLALPAWGQGALGRPVNQAPCLAAACQDLSEEIVSALSLDTTLTQPSILLVAEEAPRREKEAQKAALAHLRDCLVDRGYRTAIVEEDFYRSQIEPVLGSEEAPRAAVISVSHVSGLESRRIQVRGILPGIDPFQISYVEKEWVLRADQGEVGGDGSVVGSSSLSGSREEALQEAVSDATLRLHDLVAAVARSHGSHGDPGKLLRHVADVLPEAIIETSYVRDTYLETVERPYGEVYRAHVLVRPDGDGLARWAGQAKARLEEEQSFWLLRVALAIGAGPIIFLGVMFLDTITRGYLTWQLRSGGLLAYVAALWILVGGAAPLL
jgi:hypothetical protein